MIGILFKASTIRLRYYIWELLYETTAIAYLLVAVNTLMAAITAGCFCSNWKADASA